MKLDIECFIDEVETFLKNKLNDKIAEIVETIPKRSLSLCFLDPYGLHLDIERLKILSTRRIDLIVFFPDRLDALRNWARYYLDNPESNLDRCLGAGVDWRARLNETPSHLHAEAFRDMYIEQICRELGYPHYDFKRVYAVGGQPLYYLIFFSQHEFGALLWQRTSANEPGGQRTFRFSE